MISFKQYIKYNEGVRPLGNANDTNIERPDIYEPGTHPREYIQEYSGRQFTLDIRGNFIFYGYQTVGNKVQGFRTLKNAAKDFRQNTIGPHPGPQEFTPKEEGGNTLTPTSYITMINDAMITFKSAAKNSIRKGERFNLPDLIITPTSSSPHAFDLARSISSIERGIRLFKGIGIAENNFLPGSLKKSTKEEIFNDLFEYAQLRDDLNLGQELNQNIIDFVINHYNKNLIYRNIINDNFERMFFKLTRTRSDLLPLINRTIEFLLDPDIPINKEISMADHIRIGKGGHGAHDNSMVGYFKHSNILANRLQEPGNKNIWVVDDNISTRSTVYAGEHFLRGFETPNRKFNISWWFLIKG